MFYVDIAGMREHIIDALTYPVYQTPDANGDPQPPINTPVPLQLRSLLHGLIGFIYHWATEVNNPITARNCKDIDPDEFTEYRCSTTYLTFGHRSIPQPLVQSKGRTPAEEFSRTIKIDPSL